MQHQHIRASELDPEDPHLQIRKDLERQRIRGDAFWGGRSLKDEYVYIEGAVYHWTGKVKSIQFGQVELEDSYKIFNNQPDRIETRDKMKVGTIYIPVISILALGVKGEIAWY